MARALTGEDPGQIWESQERAEPSAALGEVLKYSALPVQGRSLATVGRDKRVNT